MNSPKRQSVKRKSTSRDSLLCEPLLKKNKRKRLQHVHTNKDTTTDISKNTLTSINIETSETRKNMFDKMIERRNEPETFAKSVQLITDEPDSDDAEIDVVNFDTDRLQQPPVEKAATLGSRVSAMKSETKRQFKTNENTLNSNLKSKIIPKHLSVSERMHKLFFPNNKPSKFELTSSSEGRLKAMENMFDDKAEIKKNLIESGDDCNTRSIIETSIKSVDNSKQLNNNFSVTEENECVIDIEIKNEYSDFLPNDNLSMEEKKFVINNKMKKEYSSFTLNDFRLKIAKVVLDRSIVNSYLKTKPLLSNIKKESDDATENVTKNNVYKIIDDSKINRKVNNKQNQRQTTMFNFFTTQNISEVKSAVNYTLTGKNTLMKSKEKSKKSIIDNGSGIRQAFTLNEIDTSKSDKNVSFIDTSVKMEVTDEVPVINTISATDEATRDKLNTSKKNDVVQEIPATSGCTKQVLYAEDGGASAFCIILRSKTANIPDMNILDASHLNISKKGIASKVQARRLIVTGKKNPVKAKKSLRKLYCTRCKETFDREFVKGKRAIKNCPKCYKCCLHAQCVKCRKVMRTKSVWRHVIKFCEDSIKCNHCDFATLFKSKLITHIQVKHTEIKCLKCGTIFKHEKYKKIHEKRCGKIKDYWQCQFCSYKSKYYHNVRYHARTHIMHLKDESIMPSLKIDDNPKIVESCKLNSSSKIRKSFSTNNDYTSNIDSKGHAAVQAITPQSFQTDPTAGIKKLAIFKCLKCNASDPSTTFKPIECVKCKVPMRYCCKSCQRTYSCRRALRQHFRFKCASPQQYECEHCDGQFTDKHRLRRHIFAEHMDERDSKGYFKCPKCKSKFKSRSGMLNHKKNCGMEPLLTCKLCEYKTNFKANLRAHMRSNHRGVGHQKIEHFVDEICKKAKEKRKGENKNETSSKAKAKTKTDILTQIPKNTLKILPANKNETSFKSEAETETNKLVKLPINTKIVPVNENGYQIISETMNEEEKKNTLHMILVKCLTCSKAHTLDKKKKSDKFQNCTYCRTAYRFECLQCSKEYNICYKLRSHIKREHLLDPDNQRDSHECSKCGKRFTFLQHLKRHWRYSCLVGTKKFFCDYCDFATKRNDSLQRHCKRKHMDKKITKYHECGKCEFKFVKEEDLQRHMSTCSGGYKCDECGAKFTTKIKLIEHIESKKINQFVKS